MDTNRIMEDRLKKVEELRAQGVNPYANGFTPTHLCQEALTMGEQSELPSMKEVAPDATLLKVAGRLMAKNKMGKAMFVRIKDRSLGNTPSGQQTFQLYLKKDILGEEAFGLMKSLDVGDFIGVSGRLFATRTGETTLMVEQGALLTKSIRPLPEKFHGLKDVETRYRQRYVDLIMNAEVRQVFQTRSLVLSYLRRFFEERAYVEVETPMMHTIPGGASARPFETYHNALGIPLYMRIAPELFLKRLVVGGMERVFEVNRNFRNEGLSPKHNPEFTMLEFYQAYATYEDLIILTEELLCGIAKHVNGDEQTTRPYGEHTIDFARPFARYSVRESLVELGGLTQETVDDPEALRATLDQSGVTAPVKPGTPYGLLLMSAFEAFVEHKLIQPTFITDYPVEDSPLARRNEASPAYVDRFELFIAGTEIANGFSELNDPVDQRQRFEDQVQARDEGDKEAMYMDLDYVRALEYGLPPTAGEGIGIDRVVMLMTNTQTIREVILFPHMRPE